MSSVARTNPVDRGRSVLIACAMVAGLLAGLSAGAGVVRAAGADETYACSPHSQALLSQVEMMKAAGSELRKRWEQQGFVMGGPNPGYHPELDQTFGGQALGLTGGQSAAIAETTPTYTSAPAIQNPGIPADEQQQFSFTPDPLPSSVRAGNPGVEAFTGSRAVALSNGASAEMMSGDPMATRQKIDATVNSVNPMAPDYSRFFTLYPSMKQHMEEAKRMGLGPGPIVMDPATVARQFGMAYDPASTVVLNNFNPPNTGSVLSRIALGIRSLFN